jgi:RB1-inducible coiled-coil protein 1
MKEIGGLSTRLYKLDELLNTSKSLLQTQTQLHSSLLTTTGRANSLNDASILPDLHDSHKKQLALLQENLKRLSDIDKRVGRWVGWHSNCFDIFKNC